MSDTPLGAWLRELFRSTKWTQAGLARATGLTPTTISRLTKGERLGTDPDTTKAIAQAVGMSHAELLSAIHGRPLPRKRNGESEVEAAIRRDNNLTAGQVEALLTVYRSYVGRRTGR